MQMKRACLAWLISLVVVIGALPGAAPAQLPVIDAANLTQNTISAVQSVLIVTNQLLDLLAVDAFSLDDGTFMEDLATLQGFASEASAISWDLATVESQIASLFHLSVAPSNTSDLVLAMRQYRSYVWQAYSYAMRVQTLIRTVVNTVNHIVGVYGTIQNL